MKSKLTTADRAGLALCAVLGGFAFAALIALLGSRPTYCGRIEDDPNCMREWVAAASGWGGAFVTVITLIYLARQVRALNIPFIQMRMSDIVAEHAAIDELASSISIGHPESIFDEIGQIRVDLIGSTQSSDNIDSISKRIYIAISKYHSAARKVMSFSSAQNNAKILEHTTITREAIVLVIINLTKIGGEITNSKIDETLRFPSGFQNKEFDEALADMARASAHIQKWHWELSKVIEAKRKTIDQIIDA